MLKLVRVVILIQYISICIRAKFYQVEGKNISQILIRISDIRLVFPVFDNKDGAKWQRIVEVNEKLGKDEKTEKRKVVERKDVGEPEL